MTPAPRTLGRAAGAAVGTLFGAGWWAFALRPASPPLRGLAGAVGLFVTVALLAGAGRLVFAAPRTSSSPPPPTSRRQGWAFALLVVAEVVLLNVAVAPLSGPAVQVYVVPTISAVVGLHFLPMAWLFRRPELTTCGLLMLAGALLALAGLAVGAPPVAAVAAESLANGAALWLAAARNLRAAPPGG